MRAMQRGAGLAFALIVGATSAPSELRAQVRGLGPNPDTPRLLVSVFFSPDRTSGVQAADAIRNRVEAGANIKQLYVIPWSYIKPMLERSDIRADSALGLSDLKELAKLLRADEVLAGAATRASNGTVTIEPRLMLARDLAVAQPLPAVSGNNAGDASRQIERSLQEARKQLPDNKACENAIRDSKNDQAIAFAKAGIAKFPGATIARLCLVNAFVAMKAPPDSALRVSREILRLDPKNTRALGYIIEGCTQKGDSECAVEALMKLYELEPGNQRVIEQIIAELAKLGQPAKALKILRELLAQNPADPQLLRQQWLLSMADAVATTDSAALPAKWAAAVAAGEEMIRADTTLADSTFFDRQILAANKMVPPRGGEFAAMAVRKFPNSPGFWFIKANAERKAGQSQMAIESLKRALAINPRLANGNLLLAQLYLDLSQPDSGVAVARRAVAGGEDPKTWAAFLLGPTQTAWRIADTTKAIPDYEKALALAEESEKLSPSETSAFFAGIASFSIGYASLQQAQKPKSCPLAKRAQEMFVKTLTYMPRGVRVERNTTTSILTYVTQLSPTADQMVKQYCK